MPTNPIPPPSPLALLDAARRELQAAGKREALVVLEALAGKVEKMVENEGKQKKRKVQ